MDSTESDLLESSAAGGLAVRGGTLRVGGYLVSAVAGALSAAVLFRHLHTELTGLYVLASSIVAIVGGVSDLGMTTLGLRELAIRDASGRHALMRTLLGLRLFVTVLGVGIAVAFAAVADYSSAVVAGVALAGIGLLFQNLQTTLSIDLMRNLRLGWVTIFEVGRQLGLALLVIALALSGAGLVMILGASIPVALAALAATVVLLRGHTPMMPSFNRAQWMPLLRELLPLSIAVATSVLYFRLSIVIVSLLANAHELSYFGASFRVIEVLTQIPLLMVSAAFPIFARAAHGDHTRFAYGIERVFERADREHEARHRQRIGLLGVERARECGSDAERRHDGVTDSPWETLAKGIGGGLGYCHQRSRAAHSSTQRQALDEGRAAVGTHCRLESDHVVDNRHRGDAGEGCG
jgi:O-antigen/teichoic acid export membrane protein